LFLYLGLYISYLFFPEVKQLKDEALRSSYSSSADV
jgi:hypothetical protein